jgi:hypothetical protein
MKNNYNKSATKKAMPYGKKTGAKKSKNVSDETMAKKDTMPKKMR